MKNLISSTILTAIALSASSLYGNYCPSYPSCPPNNCNYIQQHDKHYKKDHRESQAQKNDYYYDKSTQPSDRNFNNTDQDTSSDKKLENQLNDLLRSGWFSEGVQVVSYTVNNGNITLKGTVKSIADKDKIGKKVSELDGVKHVSNQIQIRSAPHYTSDQKEINLQEMQKNYPQDEAATPSDRQINAKIREYLSEGWLTKGNKLIIIRTVNGFVTLIGTPDNSKDIPTIIEKIKTVEGVKEINDQLNRISQ